MAGRGGGTLVAAGVGTTAVGFAAIWAASPVTWMGTTSAGAGGAAVLAANVIFLGGSIMIGMGIKRAMNNSRVGDRIETRATSLPVNLLADESRDLDVFFPISPSPQRLTITYSNSTGDHELDMDTSKALAGLHLAPETSKPPPAATDEP